MCWYESSSLLQQARPAAQRCDRKMFTLYSILVISFYCSMALSRRQTRRWTVSVWELKGNLLLELHRCDFEVFVGWWYFDFWRHQALRSSWTNYESNHWLQGAGISNGVWGRSLDICVRRIYKGKRQVGYFGTIKRIEDSTIFIVLFEDSSAALFLLLLESFQFREKYRPLRSQLLFP